MILSVTLTLGTASRYLLNLTIWASQKSLFFGEKMAGRGRSIIRGTFKEEKLMVAPRETGGRYLGWPLRQVRLVFLAISVFFFFIHWHWITTLRHWMLLKAECKCGSSPLSRACRTERASVRKGIWFHTAKQATANIFRIVIGSNLTFQPFLLL